MKVLKRNPDICVECRLCEDTCSLAFRKEKDSEKSAIKVDRDREGTIHLVSCTQCGKCVDVCPVLALKADSHGVVRLTQKNCVGCYMCVGACPEEAMMYHKDYTEPFKCVACGLCVKSCPTGALSLEA